MNVVTILKQKGTQVTTVSAATTLLDASRKLAAKRIGAVIVSDGEGHVQGILSERDIVRAIAQGGADILSAPVSDIMTRDVVTCAEDASLDDVMHTMTRGRFRHVPVVDAKGRLAGIISIGDAVKHQIGEIKLEAEAMKEYIARH